MERINHILNHDLFKCYVSENAKEEKYRQFCKHDLGHALDVARIAWILNLEEEAGLSKDLVYGAALLHDIGRYLQYRDGTPHEQASATLAEDILDECGFTESECREILQAILSHRDIKMAKKKDLSGVIYRADKMSRACFGCKMEKECNWKPEKKNMVITL